MSSLLSALPFLAVALAVYASYRYGRWTEHRDHRGRIIALESEVDVVHAQMRKHMARDSAEISVEARAAKRQGAAVPPWHDPSLDPEVRRSALRQAFAARDAQARAG